MKYKWIINKFILNSKWTSLGKYMEPEIEFLPDQRFKSYVGGHCSYGIYNCSIKIREKYRNDIGIQEHELCHARQFGRLLWLHSILGIISGTYRLLIELEAYRSQVSNYNYTDKKEYEWIVDALHTKYNLKKDIYEIRELCDFTFLDLL